MKKWIDKSLGYLLIFLLGLMVINVVWQVFSRYVLDSPSSITEELARYLMIWLGLLGGAYAIGQRLHLAIDLLPQSLTGEKARWLDAAIYVLVAVFSLLILVIGGGNLIYITLSTDQTSAALGVPLGYLYLALPLSGLLTIYYAIAMIVQPPQPEPLDLYGNLTK
jgi:TRAP-type C4-dicarboxylate transport system permease small subunit